MQIVRKQIYAMILEGMRSKERFWQLLEISLSLKLYEIVSELLSFAVANAEKLLDSNNFLRVKSETVSLVYSLDNLNVSESILLTHICRWQQFNKLPTEDQSVKDLLSRVKFKNLTSMHCLMRSSQYKGIISKDDTDAVLRHLLKPTDYPLPRCFSEERKLDTKIDTVKQKVVEAEEISKDNCTLVLEDEALADVLISVGTQKTEFHAHRFLLALGCKFFKEMFYGPRQKTKVVIPDEDPEKFGIFLKYFYGSCAEKLKSSSLSSVLYAYDLSRKYGFHDLEVACSKFFETTAISPDAFWVLLDHGRTLPQCTVNNVEITAYAQVQSKWILDDESFLRAPRISLVQFLQNDYFNASEYDILCRVAQWLEINQKDILDKETQKEILKNIRLQNLTTEELDQILISHGDLFSEGGAAAIRAHELHPSQGKFPDWCLKGTRGLSFGKSTKIGTMHELKYVTQACKSTNTFEATFTVTLLNNKNDYNIQYLELSWEFKDKKSLKNPNTKCNILVKFRGSKNSVNFTDVEISNCARVMVPVSLKMNTENPKEHIHIVVTMSTYHKLHFLKQNALNFGEMEIQINSGKCCLSDAVVNDKTSEDVPVPEHILSRFKSTATSTDTWCK